MKDKFLTMISETQSTEVVTSYGGDADTRISPQVITAIYHILQSILQIPM
jgi:hypothetical protein